MIHTIAISGYRSLRNLVLPLAGLNLVTGANGTGKSSLYRALRLLADAALNTVVASLAREGGLPSTLWAGPETIARSVRRGEHPVEGTLGKSPSVSSSASSATPSATASTSATRRLRKPRFTSTPPSSANASGMAASIGELLSWSIGTTASSSSRPHTTKTPSSSQKI
jgi:predicted ATPase